MIKVNRCNINRRALSDKLSELHQEYDDLKDKLQECDEKTNALLVEGNSLENTMKNVEEERQNVLREVTTAELDLNELRQSVERQEEVQLKNQQKKRELETEMNDKQNRIQEITPQLDV